MSEDLDQEALEKQIARLRKLQETLEEQEAGLTQQDKDIRNECEQSLATFIRYMWRYIDPAKYKHNWHIDAISEHLEAMVYGDIHHLLVNVSPRCMKPVYEEELVLSKRGLVPLKEIILGDEVFTHKNRWKKVLNVFIQGELDTLKIETCRGRSVIAAPDHPFYTSEGWAQLKDIKQEDVVGISSCDVELGENSISAEEARLLGYLVGDGHCSGTPNITVADDLECEDIKRCITKIGFIPKEYNYNSSNSKIRRISITAGYSEDGRTKSGYMGPVKRWLNGHKLLKKSSYTKSIPDSVLRGNDEVVKNFIGAYWACDGHIGTKGVKRDGSKRTDLVIRCDSVNKSFLEQLQILLLRIGINSSLKQKVRVLKTKKQGDTYTSYTLSLYDQDACYKFSRLINCSHEKFSSMLATKNRRFDFNRDIYGDVVKSVSPSGINKCRCLEVDEDHSFVVNGFIVHNSILGSVSLAPWVWTLRDRSYRTGPETSFLYSSYGQKLSFEHSLKARTLIDSPLYQKLWGGRIQLLKDQNTITKFTNSSGGYRMATSVGSNLTGSGAAIIGVDDPHNTVEMESETAVQSVIDWWDTALSTRLNDPVEGRFFVIMQRLRENDLSGHILDQNQGEWTHLCYDKDTEILTKNGWVKFSDLNKNIEVMGVNPATLEAKWEQPTLYFKEKYIGDMFHWNSQSFDLMVTPDHRMIYWEANDYKKKENPQCRIRAAKEMTEYFYAPQVVKWAGNSDKVFFGGREWEPSIFAEFMGWYLSEGCANGKFRTTRIVQKIGGKFCEEIDQLMSKIPFNVSKYKNSSTMYCWQIKDKTLSKELEIFGKSKEKHAPRILKELSPVFLEKFIISYAKGDGNFSKKNDKKITISSSSERMIDDLQEMCLKCSWATSKNQHLQLANGRCLNGTPLPDSLMTKLYIRINKKKVRGRKDGSQLRKNHKKIISYNDFVYCVSVPSTGIVVRRNGRVTISGNCIPMEHDSDRHCTTSIGFSDPRIEDGELMWPDRIDRKALTALKTKLGDFGASGQLQQAPVPKGGGIIKDSWWQPYIPGSDGFFPPMEYIIASCDTAYTEKTENDYSTCIIIGVYRDQYDLPKIMVMNAWQARLGLNALVNKIAETAKRFKVDRLIIENKASGISVSQEMRRLFGNEIFGIVMNDPKGDKVARLMAVEPLFAEGIVHVPYIQDSDGTIHSREWIDMLIKQVTGFPKASHDDLVDALSQGIKHLRDNGLIVRRVERDIDLERRMEHRGQKLPLYDV